MRTVEETITFAQSFLLPGWGERLPAGTSRVCRTGIGSLRSRGSPPCDRTGFPGYALWPGSLFSDGLPVSPGHPPRAALDAGTKGFPRLGSGNSESLPLGSRAGFRPLASMPDSVIVRCWREAAPMRPLQNFSMPRTYWIGFYQILSIVGALESYAFRRSSAVSL